MSDRVGYILGSFKLLWDLLSGNVVKNAAKYAIYQWVLPVVCCIVQFGLPTMFYIGLLWVGKIVANLVLGNTFFPQAVIPNS
ncbi:MAG TPA: hypothetical protein PK239_04620 [Chitinophagales bacterium]|nr:hypothetical protein [Chitinophagales bacterium]HRK26557.1 hypothetical protein [Chitinophagales bacterium]